MKFYLSLVGLATSNKDFDFVLRYKPVAVSFSKAKTLYLSGYGVELAVKDTEYLAVDDRSSSDHKSNVDVSEADGITDNDQLFGQHPTISPINKKTIKEISLSAIAYARNTSAPLETLTRISLEFPRLAHRIPRGKLAKISKLARKMVRGPCYSIARQCYW
jgi:UDP-glucose:glycoprotein glucosyltransferase